MLLECDTPAVINLWFGGVFHSLSFHYTPIYTFRKMVHKYGESLRSIFFSLACKSALNLQLRALN